MTQAWTTPEEETDMPYVPQEIRQELESRPPCTVGELTYLLYREAAIYVESDGSPDSLRRWCYNLCTVYLHDSVEESFHRHATILGALTSCRMELIRHPLWLTSAGAPIIDEVLDDFYRDFTAPYEDKKRRENGDVP